LKPVFIIAIVAVAMIGVMVPIVFAERASIDDYKNMEIIISDVKIVEQEYRDFISYTVTMRDSNLKVHEDYRILPKVIRTYIDYGDDGAFSFGNDPKTFSGYTQEGEEGCEWADDYHYLSGADGGIYSFNMCHYVEGGYDEFLIILDYSKDIRDYPGDSILDRSRIIQTMSSTGKVIDDISTKLTNDISSQISGTINLEKKTFSLSKYSTTMTTISGIVDSDSRGQVELNILKNNEIIVQQKMKLTSSGKFSLPIMLDEKFSPGSYTVTGMFENSIFDEVTFEILDDLSKTEEYVVAEKSENNVEDTSKNTVPSLDVIESSTNNSNFKTYQNNEFNFSMDYFSGWTLDDQQMDGFDFNVALTNDLNYEQDYSSIQIFYNHDSLQLSNAELREFDNAFATHFKEMCEENTFEIDGFICNDFEVLETDVNNNNNLYQYKVVTKYSEKYPDSTKTKFIQIFLALMENGNVWQIFASIPSEKYNICSKEMWITLNSIEINSDLAFLDESTKMIPTNDNLFGDCIIEKSHEELEKSQYDSSSTEKETSANAGGGCLIATATYGSELAPQVQQLRELRDNQLLNTESGTAFMSTFNNVYYSFSPIIADYERENPLFREAVKIAITPMISTLSLMENAETESEVLSTGISVIALNLGMYLGVPAIVIVGIRKKF